MVIGVLAMLFIIGSTLLIVARFEKRQADKQSSARNMQVIVSASVDPILTQLRQDAVGTDGIPYNRPWNAGEESEIEDYEDFPGFVGTATPADRVRSGDLLLSSIAPYEYATRRWRQRYVTWPADAVSAGASVERRHVLDGPLNLIDPNGSGNPGDSTLTKGPKAACRAEGDLDWYTCYDTDGDGGADIARLADVASASSTLMAMFAGAKEGELRVISHGGMVLLDPFTHPLLLAQVIHPQDTSYHNDPLSLWPDPFNASATNNVVLSTADEARLRRRFILPADLGRDASGAPLTTASLDANDVRRRLPVTLGYEAPSGADQNIIRDLTPHWWPADDQVVSQDADWWQQRLLPPAHGLRDTGYNAAADVYDRRHMLTTVSSDDVLRRQREEGRLAVQTAFQDPNTNRFMFAEVLGPQSDAGTDLGAALPAIPVYPATGSLPPLPLAGTFALEDAGTGAPMASPYTRRYFDYGRDDAGNLRFNVPGLRTQFSLRDVLDPYTGQGTYPKAAQLTAYFLAMMQHTAMPWSDADLASVPPGDLPLLHAGATEQLQAAAQLAVNAIDFADSDGDVLYDATGDGVVDGPDGTADQVSTYFEWPAGTPRVRVLGVEKQPYLTEAYVKLILRAKLDGMTYKWDPNADTESIYAVELYNPYSVPLSLVGYRLSASTQPDLGLFLKAEYPTRFPNPVEGGFIPPYSYIVIANRTDDAATGADPFIVDPATGWTATEGVNLFVDPSLRIRPGNPVSLIRTGKRILRLTPGGFEFPATGLEVKVDQMTPTESPWPENGWAEHVVSIDASGQATQDDLDAWPDQPGGVGDKLVRDTSLQRHKESTPVLPAVRRYMPSYWHFTLDWQCQFPPAAYESWFYDKTAMQVVPRAEPPDPLRYSPGYPLTYGANRPAQHNLLCVGTGPVEAPSDPIDPVAPLVANQALAAAELLGLGLNNYFVFPTPYNAADGIRVSTNGGALTTPTAPMPVLTADRGIDPLSGGTMAFPTTGALLLVTRYAHLAGDDPTDWADDLSAGARATRLAPGSDQPGKGFHEPVLPGRTDDLAGRTDQMQQLDNGHLPIFDPLQRCVDLTTTKVPAPQGRLDVPWGQLVYDYFTALPLEELVRRYDFQAMDDQAGGANATGLRNLGRDTRMLDLVAEDYARAYRYLLPYYPLVDRVADAPSALGPKVLGRINVNLAPWWVLDGLPVLPDGLVGTAAAIPPVTTHPRDAWLPTSGVPILELESSRLDPAWPAFTANHDRAGQVLSQMLFDPGNAAATTMAEYLPSASSALARYLVSRRENRPVDGLDADHPVLNPPNPWAPTYVYPPGFVSVGAIASMLHRVDPDETTAFAGIPVTVRTRGDDNVEATLTLPLGELRRYAYRTDTSNPNSTARPYAYLGYLQLVAPLVRLEDWVTVKSHAFTIYANVGDTSDPQLPLWMRMQMTVDRTGCLYREELPRRVTETLPIAYQNAVDDQ